MSAVKAFVLRVIVGVAGLALAAAAVWVVALGVGAGWAQRVAGYADLGFWGALPSQEWFGGALSATAGVLIVVGVVLLWCAVDRRGVSQWQVEESAGEVSGRIVVRLDDVASAVAQDLARVPGVTKARYAAQRDRGDTVLTIRLRVAPDADIDGVRAVCRQAAEDIRGALPGEEIATRFILEINRITKA